MSSLAQKKKDKASSKRQSKEVAASPSSSEDEGEEIPYEDPFVDQFEEEEIVEAPVKTKKAVRIAGAASSADAVEEMDDGMEGEEGEEEGEEFFSSASATMEALARVGLVSRIGADGVTAEVEDGEDGEAKGKPKKAFLPARDHVKEGEELDFDNRAYTMLHRMNMEWPCLSFDIVTDELGDSRRKFPMTAYVVCGSQADRAANNRLYAIKAAGMARTMYDDREEDVEDEMLDSDDDEELDDEYDEEATVETKTVGHTGGVNRIRTMPQSRNLMAVWNERGTVEIYDFATQLHDLDGAARHVPDFKGVGAFKHMTRHDGLTALFSFDGHGAEGFALDWSSTTEGRLASGDINGKVFVWHADKSGWTVDPAPFQHRASVEDIQWSPVEANVFAACSSDHHIYIWDIRQKAAPAIAVEAHSSDVNVISWNRLATHMLASGGDDGALRIWDLRNFRKESPAAEFLYHRGPITTVEWSPHESSVVAVASEDNSLTVWDLSLEHDPEAPAPANVDMRHVEDVPPQLIFEHLGQKEPKELHWHPQLPGVIMSTASNGMNIFRPMNL